MSNHNKMAAIALSLGVSLGTMAQSPIVYAKTMDVKEVASTIEAKEYTVSTDEELAKRKENLKPFEPKVKEGYLSRYARLVSSASSGAVFR